MAATTTQEAKPRKEAPHRTRRRIEHRQRKAERRRTADALNYFALRSAFGPFHTVPKDGPREMEHEDIANVTLVSVGELYDALSMIADAMPMHHAIDELTDRWELGDVDPEAFDVSDEPFEAPPLKSAAAAAVPFRSSL